MIVRHISSYGNAKSSYGLWLNMTDMHSCGDMEIRDARKRAGMTQVELREATRFDHASSAGWRAVGRASRWRT
jgi:hypothetical protein